ncbi:MAG: hypothetical protein RI973_1143 [Bacteroidota bacterium]|jgi:hypothetical protein
MKNLIFLLPGFLCQHLVAQPQLADARSAGLGHLPVASLDAWSLLGNQAGLASLHRPAAFVTASQPFFVNGLHEIAAGIVLPSKAGTFGLSLQRFGFNAYRQQKAGLAYGRLLSEAFQLGVQFDYFHTALSNQQSRHSFTFELGILGKLSQELELGLQLFNPTGRLTGSAYSTLPVIYRQGLVWLISEKALISALVEKESGRKINAGLGLEYGFLPGLQLRAGFGISPPMVGIGIGYSPGKGVQFNAATRFHQLLGPTPFAAVCWNRS